MSQAQPVPSALTWPAAARAGVRVTVPASSANLGSGFDALGLALALYDTVEVRPVESGSVVQVYGEGAATVPRDASHLVVRALAATCVRLGVPTPAWEVCCHNAIPHARGLGSSAAAVVAGVAAGYALAGRPLDDDALALAAEFEGHADNAAASLYGGLVVGWRENDRYRAVRLQPHPTVHPVVLVPTVESVTATTRGLLPAQVPHADAAFAAGRAALAVHALTAAPEFLLSATEDRLHQHYREAAWPETLRLVTDLRAAGVPAAVSGAGPSVLALPLADGLPEDVDYAEFSVLPLEISQVGVRAEPLD